MPVLQSRIAEKARCRRQALNRTRKRRRADGEGVESSQGVTAGGGPKKRHRQAGGAVSGAASASSGVAAIIRVVRARPSARPPLRVTSRLMAVETTEIVTTQEVGFCYSNACSSVVVRFASSGQTR